jgi:hypothetical protein
MNKRRHILVAAVVGALANSMSVAHGQANLGVTVPKINPFDRDQVVNLWRTFAYTTQTLDRNVEPNWTGSVAGCNPGTTAKGYQQLAANQLNVRRALMGQANVMLDDDIGTRQAQAAALLMLAEESLTHYPAATAKCYTADAAAGAIASNLGLARIIPSPTGDAFFDDFGEGNYYVGHRVTLVDAEFRYAAFGLGVDFNQPRFGASSSIRVRWAAAPASEPALIAWPVAGYFPAQLLPFSSKRWSLGCPDCNASGASVTVTAGGTTAAATLEPLLPTKPYDSNVVFLLPAGIQSRIASFLSFDANRADRKNPDYIASNFADFPVDITVRGMKDPQGRVMPDISYRTIIINPDSAAGKTMPTRRYDGIWTASQDGTGLTIVAGNTGSLVGRWFTRDANGQTVWYTLADGRWTSTTSYAGKLYMASPNGQSVVGGASLTFNGGNAAQLSYTVGSSTGVASLTRSQVGSEAYVWGTHNFTGEWATNAQSTSLLALSQDFRSVDGAYLTLDANGRPTWYRVTPNSIAWDANNANSFTAGMQAATGSPVGRFSFAAQRVAPANPAETSFIPDENSATLGLSLGTDGQVSYATVRKQGNGVFNQGNASIALSQRGGLDIDGNGRSQLVVRNATAGLMQAGRLVGNQFQWSMITDPGTGFRVLGAADLAGTGKSDLLFQSTTQGEFGDVTAWTGFNPASAKFIRSVKTAWNVQGLSDMDGDGKGDLVWRWQGNDADTGVSYIWFTDVNSATPVNQVRKRGGAPLSWTLLGAADLNGDGAADMVYVSPDNQIRVLMATGSVSAPRTCANYAAGTIPAGFAVLKFADFTGARRGGDILIRDQVTDEVRLISLVATGIQLPAYTGDPNDRNAACTGAGSAASISTMTTSLGVTDRSWTYAASGDFNGDGVFDIAWRQPSGNLALWLIPVAGAPTVVLNAGSIPSGFSPIALQ